MGNMLFNVVEDPTESTDVAEQYPKIVKRLAARLEEAGRQRTPLEKNLPLRDPPLPYVYGMHENAHAPPWVIEAVEKVRATQPKTWPEGETPWPQAPTGAEQPPCSNASIDRSAKVAWCDSWWSSRISSSVAA